MSLSCACGCGASLAPGRRWVRGHNKRTSEARLQFSQASSARWASDPRYRSLMRGETHPNWVRTPTYSAVHKWLLRNHPKVGVCERCGTTGPSGKTEYALLADRHVRDRECYAELCAPCHRRFDKNRPAHGWRKEAA